MKRIISIVLCIALCFNFFVFSSYANVVDGVLSILPFWSFAEEYYKDLIRDHGDIAFAEAPLGAIWQDYSDAGQEFTAANLQTAYDSYVADLDAVKGTHIIGDTGFCIMCTPVLVSNNRQTPYTVGATWVGSIDGYTANAYGGIGYCYIYFNPIAAPVAGTYTPLFKFYVQNDVYRKMHPSISEESRVLSVGDSVITADSFVYFEGSSSKTNQSVTGSLSFWVTPAFFSIESFAPASSRAPSIITNIINSNPAGTVNKYYIGTKTGDTITNVYETNIFNETTKVLTLPGETPVTYNITNWNYDYSTRTYNLTDGTSNYVVTYGDDYITITVPDGNGGTISTNYYYVVQEPVPVGPGADPDTGLPIPSTDNYEDDPNTTGGFFSSIWKAFKEGLASLISGIIKGLFKGIKALIDGITSVFSGLVSGFFGFVTSFFDSFGTGPGAVGEFFGGGVVDLG